MRQWILGSVLILCGALGCAQQPPQPEFTAEDEAAIQAVFDQMAGFWVDDQGLANLDLYTEDASEVLTNPRDGKQAIRERWEGFVDRYKFSSSELQVREVIGFGDYAYASVDEESHYLYNGEPRVQRGVWMTLLRREDPGGWKIHRIIWQATARADTAAVGGDR